MSVFFTHSTTRHSMAQLHKPAFHSTPCVSLGSSSCVLPAGHAVCAVTYTPSGPEFEFELFALLLLSSCRPVLCPAVWAFVVGMDEQPLTAMQVLYVNLVTACTLGIMLAAEPPEPSVMDRPPRRPGKRLLVSVAGAAAFSCARVHRQVLNRVHTYGRTVRALCC